MGAVREVSALIGRTGAVLSVALLAATLGLPTSASALLHGGAIGKSCVGPPDVDPLAEGKARVGDEAVCDVTVTNLDGFSHLLCVESITDKIVGGCSEDGSPCERRCNGGADDGVPCLGDADCTLNDCLDEDYDCTCSAPPFRPSGELVPGITMGVCDGGDDEGVPCVDDSDCAGGALCGSFCVGKVGGAGDGGKPCTSGAECSSGNCGTCAGFLLDEKGPEAGSRVTVQHKYTVLPADADAGDYIYDDASSNGYDVGTDLLFSLTFPGAIRIIECAFDEDCPTDTECADHFCNDTNECDVKFWSSSKLCGDQTDTDCKNPDTCDGLGTCQDNDESESSPCSDTDDNVCTTAGCDAAALCDQNHILEPDGTECGDQTDTDCKNPDTCDGLGTCQDNDESESSPCSDTDGDDCTTAGCDAAGGCDQEHIIDTTNLECILDCGDAITDQCVVSVSGLANVFCGPPPLGELSDPSCTKNFDERNKLALQKAIDAAPNGATITVTGRCFGPIRVTERANLTITGVKPTDDWECPPLGPGPADLTSTVAGGCDGDLDNCELIKMTKSPKVTVQYLNIVDSSNSGLEWKRTQDGVAFCNCIARNAEDGIEFDKGRGGHLALQNLVKENAKFLEPDVDFGIAVHNVSGNLVQANKVVSNLRGGISVESDDDSHSYNNILSENEITDNAGHGISLVNTKGNQVTCNTVFGNDGGVRLLNADDDCIDENAISSNGDGLEGEISCGAGSENNTGSNVPIASPCSSPNGQACSGPAECMSGP